MNHKIAIKIMLSLLASVIVFHFCILLKIIPYEFTWGGSLKNDSEMYVFETLSITMNLFLGFTLLIKGNYTRQIIPLRITNIVLWVFFMLFVLNTIGNIFAKTNLEKLFTVLTLVFSVLIWVILRAKNQK